MVSIPFKRESVSKGKLWNFQTCRQCCFNSLQTGKRIQSLTVAALQSAEWSFNSLQTGKRIQRDPILHIVGPWLRTPKSKRELREGFFNPKFVLKIPRTLMNIDPNAIF